MKLRSKKKQQKITVVENRHELSMKANGRLDIFFKSD